MACGGHVRVDNRHGLVANVCVTAGTGTAEREAAVPLLTEGADAVMVGGDKGFDVPSFVAGVRARGSRRTSPRRSSKQRYRGGELVDWIVPFTAIVYNLIRLRTLLARPT